MKPDIEPAQQWPYQEHNAAASAEGPGRRGAQPREGSNSPKAIRKPAQKAQRLGSYEMDKTDIMLIRMLSENSRVPYRELAKSLSLSVNAVHKRIRELAESGIISEFNTSVPYCDGHMVGAIIFGRSESADIDETAKALGKNNLTAQVVVAGGNYIYVVGFLRDLSQLDKYSSFAIKEARICEPHVGIGIDDSGNVGSMKLAPLDYKIAYALRWNSRKEISDIAKEIKVSAKTVHRRLERMVEGNMVFFSIDRDYSASNDIITLFHLKLKKDASRDTATALLANKYRPNYLFHTAFSNFPDFFLATFWSKTMKELKGIQDRLKKEGLFETIVPNIGYTIYNFDTWTADWLKDKAYPKDE